VRRAPKFPSSMNVRFSGTGSAPATSRRCGWRSSRWRRWRSGDLRSGGGAPPLLHRRAGLVPSFEKMLYDNARRHATSKAGRRRARLFADRRETLDAVGREMPIRRARSGRRPMRTARVKRNVSCGPRPSSARSWARRTRGAPRGSSAPRRRELRKGHVLSLGISPRRRAGLSLESIRPKRTRRA